MIQPIDNSPARASSATKASSSDSTGVVKFAAALASASQDAGAVTGDLKTNLKPPKGETWGPVSGHGDYADILSGPRNGFYVDLAPGPRQGKAFVIVHKAGKTYHVYGEGKDKQWVPVRTNPADLKPPKGESWTPVEHHTDYKEIEGGQRAHQFVNLSGNVRTGETFTIEHHDGKTWHAYGQTEVAVGGHRKKPAGDG